MSMTSYEFKLRNSFGRYTVINTSCYIASTYCGPGYQMFTKFTFFFFKRTYLPIYVGKWLFVFCKWTFLANKLLTRIIGFIHC